MKYKNDEFVKDHSERDWDGYGAEPLNLKSYEWACSFIDAWPGDVPLPELCCDPDGEVSLDWPMRINTCLSASMSDKGVLAYAFYLSDRNNVNGACEFNGKTIPIHFMYVFEMVCAENGVKL